MTPTIEVESVSKRFSRGVTSWRHVLKRRTNDEFWALRDVSISVDPGDALGLVGRNGSGKSTLLKCLARTLRPTSGRIVTRGRIVSLLELGAGFHPELTGRENVMLNAAVLGFDKAEILARFDDIVAYSELGAFIDEPVRQYSSGMQTRLGFAIAVHVDADIILVDEVLAVGDEVFQRRCIDTMLEFREAGRSLVVVAHQVPAIREVCNRVAVMQQGSMIFDGPTEEGIAEFRRSLARQRGDVALTEPEAASAPPGVRVIAHERDLLELRVQYYAGREDLPASARVIVCDATGMPALSTDQTPGHPSKLVPLDSDSDSNLEQ